MSDIDVTAQVRFGANDDESLPLSQCVCGAKFGHWDFSLSIYRETAYECPACHRKLYFRNRISVFEVRDAG